MSRRSSRKSINIQINQNDAIQAYSSGATKRKFTEKDLKLIKPKTQAQIDVFKANEEGKHLLLYGSPGTGKSFLALNLALKEVLKPESEYKKVIIVRSIATVRDPGSLPGELALKIAPFEEPYMAICNELFPYSKSYENLKKGGYIEFMTTSYLRGLTFGTEDCGAIVVFDECQNTRDNEFYTVLSRVGENCRIFILGDVAQVDLNKKNDISVFKDWIPILSGMESVKTIKFTHEDIVRSSFVKELVIAKEEAGL